MPGLDRETIADQLRKLGVAQHDLLLVHSSLKSFGHVTGGAATVAGALIDAIGPTGSIFVPTFNFGQLPFDPLTTPSLTGAISEAVRTLPGAIRSPHPTHPVSGIGPRASQILHYHPIMHPFGKDSPIFHLWQENAQVLLLGCDHRSSSVIHVAEVLAELPYLNRTRIGWFIENGNQREVIVARPPCSKGFNVIDEPMRRAGKIRETKIGDAKVMLMNAADIVDAATNLLAADPNALLCGECAICLESRQMNHRSG